MNEPLDLPPNPQKPKMPLGKVLLINFAIMLGYMTLVSLDVRDSHDAAWGVLAADAFLVMLQIGANLLVGLVLIFTQDSRMHSESRNQVGYAMLLGGIISGMVGFGSCFAHASIFGH